MKILCDSIEFIEKTLKLRFVENKFNQNFFAYQKTWGKKAKLGKWQHC